MGSRKKITFVEECANCAMKEKKMFGLSLLLLLTCNFTFILQNLIIKVFVIFKKRQRYASVTANFQPIKYERVPPPQKGSFPLIPILRDKGEND